MTQISVSCMTVKHTIHQTTTLTYIPLRFIKVTLVPSLSEHLVRPLTCLKNSKLLLTFPISSAILIDMVLYSLTAISTVGQTSKQVRDLVTHS